MTTESHRYQSEFARRHFAAGKAKGMAEVVLAILEARGMEAPEGFRAELIACADHDRLALLIQQAVVVDKAGDLALHSGSDS